MKNAVQILLCAKKYINLSSSFVFTGRSVLIKSLMTEENFRPFLFAALQLFCIIDLLNFKAGSHFDKCF